MTQERTPAQQERKRQTTREWFAKNPDYQRERLLKNTEAQEKKRAAALAWKAANPERARENTRRFYEANSGYSRKQERKNRLRERGLTLADFEAMLEAQGGLCKICQKVLERTRDQNVDHCHKTGHVRGILCITCNTTLGHAKDSPEILRRAASYLEEAAAEYERARLGEGKTAPALRPVGRAATVRRTG